MLENLLKLLLTLALIVAVTEVSKRNTLFGGLLAALPLISVFSFIWLYLDTGDTKKVADLSYSIFWLVLPTLPMFLLLPELLRRQIHFATSLVLCLSLTVILYGIVLLLLKRFAMTS